MTAASGDLPPKSGTNLTFNSSSGQISCGGFYTAGNVQGANLYGNLTGDVTGDVVGDLEGDVNGSANGNDPLGTGIAMAIALG